MAKAPSKVVLSGAYIFIQETLVPCTSVLYVRRLQQNCIAYFYAAVMQHTAISSVTGSAGSDMVIELDSTGECMPRV